MNSTPSRPTCTSRLTALLPPPPTPTTLMRAPARNSSASLNRSGVSRCSAIHCPLSELLGKSVSEKFLEKPPEPSGHTAERSRPDEAPRLAHMIALRVQHQPHRRRKLRIGDVIGQPAHTRGTSPPDRQIENLLRNLGHALEDGASSGEHDAGVQRSLVPGAADLIPNLVKNFFGARLEDFRQHPARHQARLP